MEHRCPRCGLAGTAKSGPQACPFCGFFGYFRPPAGAVFVPAADMEAGDRGSGAPGMVSAPAPPSEPTQRSTPPPPKSAPRTFQRTADPVLAPRRRPGVRDRLKGALLRWLGERGRGRGGSGHGPPLSELLPPLAAASIVLALACLVPAAWATRSGLGADAVWSSPYAALVLAGGESLALLLGWLEVFRARGRPRRRLGSLMGRLGMALAGVAYLLIVANVVGLAGR